MAMTKPAKIQPVMMKTEAKITKNQPMNAGGGSSPSGAKASGARMKTRPRMR